MSTKMHYEGLTDRQVEESRKKNGLNVLSPPKRDPVWKLYLEKFDDPIIRILLIAAFLSLGISFVHWEFAETIGIFIAVFLATGVAFWFELDARKKFDILNLVNDDTPIKVIRNDSIGVVSKRDLVVGDVLILGSGEEVPADCELLKSYSLQVDESCLTGESLVEKTLNEELLSAESIYPSNQIMRGTKILDGHCIAEVISIGDATEFGQVAVQLSEITGEETPLNHQLDSLAKLIGVVGLALASIMFAVSFIKDALLGSVPYTKVQFGLVSGVIISLLIMLVKVWMPIVYGGFEIAGKKWRMPRSISDGSWLRWFGIGIIFFLVFVAIGLPFGVNPLDKQSWISIDTAGHILHYFMISVTLIVVAVPEGLPMSITLNLALSMKKMLKSNNLVRKMHACETMGATTVICTDKTGTLTKNQMKVQNTDFFGLPDGKLTDDDLSKLIKESIAVNSTAHLDFSDPEKIQALGNPTEAALLLWLHEAGIDYLKIRENTPVVEQLTFSTDRKYMATIVDPSSYGEKVLYVKGAPEIILSKCRHVLYGNEIKPVEELRSHIESLLSDYQGKAMRTLGFAYEIVDDGKPRIENADIANHNLVFLGIVAISDPVREDVPDAVLDCMKAGIEVKMITGDTPGTAREIGRQIGIYSDGDEGKGMISGQDFAALSDEEALDYIKDLRIMCRARPTDKQRLVQLLQKSGSVVAVTGDGTNDAPALNNAHVGLSMGSGTSVAKEASDITLIDDSFKSITNAVLWGRSIYRNIQRFIIFQLTINVSALLIDSIGVFFWDKIPLTVTQLLWINLIMDTFAAGALASLPPDPKVMSEKPRNRFSFIVTRDMAINIFSVGLIFVVLMLGLYHFFSVYDYGNTGEQGFTMKELTIFFSIFVMLQFWNMFNAKAFFSRKSAFANLRQSLGFEIVAMLILIGQFLIVTYGGDIFRTVPLTIIEWLAIIAGTSVVVWIGELIRFANRRIPRLSAQ